MPLRNMSDLEKTVAAASGIFRDVCSEEPPYPTAKELWEGLKQGDDTAQLPFTFFLRLRKNERTRCNVQKAIASDRKRRVDVLKEETWCLYLLSHFSPKTTPKPGPNAQTKGNGGYTIRAA